MEMTYHRGVGTDADDGVSVDVETLTYQLVM